MYRILSIYIEIYWIIIKEGNNIIFGIYKRVYRILKDFIPIIYIV